MAQERRWHWRPFFRWKEVLLLLPVPALLAVGLAQLSLVRSGQVEAAELSPALYSLVALLVTSVALSLAGFRGDPFLLPLGAFLTAIGILFVNRLEPALAAQYGPDYYGAVGQRQWQWAALGLGAFCLILLLTRRWVVRGRVFSWDLLLKRYRYVVLLAGILLVVVTMIFGSATTAGGPRLWLRLGPFQFQPSELLKVLVVAFLAAYLEDKRDLVAFGGFRLWRIPLPPVPYLLPMAVMLGLSVVVLVFQRDLGPAMLLLGTFLALLYVASSRLGYLLAGVLTFVGAVVGVYYLAGPVSWLAYVRTRIEVWLSPWTASAGTQVVQGLYALASGGLIGQGLGQGSPSLIPECHTDYIFASVGEEWGLLGTMALLLIYALLVARGLSGALRSRDGFQQLLGIGLSLALALQTLIIVGGNLALIPLTGITLPFVSYGGSSLLTNWIVLALLLRISEERRGIGDR